MANRIKYSESKVPNYLQKGNWVISPRTFGEGPSSTTGFFHGVDVPAGGYAVYYLSSGSPGVQVVSNDSELINLIGYLGGETTSIEVALKWAQQNPDVYVDNIGYEYVPTQNLQLLLDSRHVASYARGNTWYDLANGIKFNAINGTLPHLDIYGTQAFEFNNASYWQSESGHELVDMGGDMTLLMWVNSTDIGERDTIFEKAGIEYNSYEHEIAVTWEPNEGFRWYSRRGTYGFGRTNSIGTSGWHLVGIKMTTGKLNGVARQGWWSIDGGAWIPDYTERSTTAILPAGPIRVGQGYAGPVESGGIGMVAVWDRTITDDEVNQVWQSQRSKYGL